MEKKRGRPRIGKKYEIVLPDDLHAAVMIKKPAWVRNILTGALKAEGLLKSVLRGGK